MRILAIRGEGLASLAAPFEIDLEQEPLASTGLFAITGETGAGKSTILDSLCLGLYGKYPRVAVRTSESAPDPGGTLLTARDERGLLRRGATSARAAVDFTAVDGRRWRATWSVHRARNRAAGRLQNAERTLVCLADASLAFSGRDTVLGEVERLTGLTFEQFRRTVLLAQGEFDMLLLADENARADLLERITGTEVYALISERVYAETQRRAQSLEVDAAAAAAIVTLPEEERARLAEEQTAIAERLSSARAALLRTGASIAALERRQALEARALEAEAALAAAKERARALEPERQRFAAIERSLTLEPALLAKQHSGKELRDAEQRLAETLECHRRALGAEAEAREALTLALAEQREASAEIRRFEPLWLEAERHDRDLELATGGLERARRTAQAAQSAVQSCDTNLARLEAISEREAREHSALLATLEARRDLLALSARASEIMEALQRCAEQRSEIEKCAVRIAHVATEIARAQHSLSTGERQLDVSERARREAAERLDKAEAALRAIDAQGIERRARDLRRLIERIDSARLIIQRHEEARAAAAAADDRRRAIAQEIAAASAGLAVLADEGERLESARHEIAGVGALADAAVSEEAARLRSTLVTGQPCPVCGAEEHADGDPHSALSALAARIRDRRAVLAREQDGLDQRRRQAIDAQTKGQSALEALEASSTREHRLLREMAAAYAKARPEILLASKSAGVDLRLGEAVVSADAVGLATTRKHAEAVETGLTGQLDEIAGHKGAVEDGRRLEREAIAAVEACRRAVNDAREKVSRLRLEQERETARASTLREGLVSTTRPLLPHLAAIGLSERDLAQDATRARREIERTVQETGALQKRQSTLTDSLAQHQRAIAGASAALDSARRQKVEAEREVAQAEALRVSALAKRSALLDGLATVEHQAPRRARREAADRVVLAARDVHAAAEKELATAEAEYNGAKQAHVARISRRREAALELARKLGEAGLSEDQAVELTAVSVEARIELGSKLAASDKLLERAGAVAVLRREELAADQAPGVDGAGVEALRAAHAAEEAVVLTLAEQQARAKARLEMDDGARRRKSTVEADLAPRRAELRVWQDVDAAIGSARGDKFRRFAQAITLEELVRLANEHLSGLAPRYRLGVQTGALALDVIDLEMGEERRAVRSLSGGERFLVSLGLALGLAGLDGRRAIADTLFIDEGFGALDPETLDIAIDALERLQSRGCKVGVITHVAGMIERIAVQVRVEKRGNGRSVVSIQASHRGP